MKNQHLKSILVAFVLFVSIVGWSSTVSASDKTTIDVKQYESIVKPMFNNKAYEEAWKDYVEVLKKVEIADGYVGDSKGTGPKQFDKMKLIGSKPKDSKFGKKGIIRVYTYKTKEAFNKEAGDEPGTANLITIYQKDKLVFVGVTNNSFLFKKENLLDPKQVESLVKGPFDFEQLKKKEVIVSGFGTSVAANKQYSVISMPSGKVEDPGMEYFALVDGKLDYITTKSMADAVENEIMLTAKALDDYILSDSSEYYKLHAPKENTTKE